MQTKPAEGPGPESFRDHHFTKFLQGRAADRESVDCSGDLGRLTRIRVLSARPFKKYSEKLS